MKTSVFCSVFAVASMCSLSTFGQATCHNNGGPNDPALPPVHGPVGTHNVPAGGLAESDELAPLSPAVDDASTNDNPNTETSPAARVANASAARITVVSEDDLLASRGAKTPTARLTIVADDAVDLQNATDIVTAAPKATEAAPEKPAAIDSRIASLVGIWRAVARRANGELTTVELQLDNRGWAELTVPGSDGKPNKTKSRVEVENDELKLKGSDDKVVSLGKLLEHNTRQMVLERAEGHVTFVRL